MADIPLIAAQWLKHFMHQNRALLDELNVNILLKNYKCFFLLIYFVSLAYYKSRLCLESARNYTQRNYTK